MFTAENQVVALFHFPGKMHKHMSTEFKSEDYIPYRVAENNHTI